MKYVSLLFCIILLMPSHIIDAQSPVTIIAPAVERTPSGLEGVLSYITVHTEKGNGHVFIDTWPLAEVDIQGSARLAVQVASDVVHKDWRAYDFFITVRSDSPIIGGPSAGGAMTVAIIAALQEWELSPGVVMSGTINPDETVGPVGGLDQKAEAASEVASLFLVPEGQTTIMVEEQEPFQVGPFTYVTTTQKEVNLIEEGKKMGIEVKEVYDIREAVFYFTGNAIESPQIEAKSIKADFMKVYAQEELGETQQEYTTVQEKISAYSGSYKEDLEDVLKSAQEEITHAKETYESGTYYTSMSASFVAGLYITYADNLLSYFNGQSVEEIFGSLDEYLNTLYEEIKKEHPHGMTALQCIAAAQKRIFEALDYLQQVQEKEDFDYIYYASYAEERGKSTEFWLNLAREYQNGEEITEEALESAVSSMMNTAELSLVYASSILPQSNVLQEAEDMLTKAETEYMNRIYASSLFSALQSKVYSEVALIAYSPEKDITQKVVRARERASKAIETSRGQGVEPVLAVTYYELAEASDSIQSLLYLRYAEEIASIINYLENQPEMPVEVIPSEKEEGTKERMGESLLFLALGVFIGMGISWIVVRATRSK